MRLGAFLHYKKYTASRHQRLGRSTWSVHPCKQENKNLASACAPAQSIPCPLPAGLCPATSCTARTIR